MRVEIPARFRTFTGGVGEVESSATTVRALIDELDTQFPGLGRELRLTSAVAVDGDIVADNIRAASLRRIDQAETILFVPAVSGG
ncbi:MAG: MoaD/ThiS family protein [Spirochaetaceae bacterium]|nr:MoaD/ThiS family protein [Spirochaetaceae bacterium]